MSTVLTTQPTKFERLIMQAGYGSVRKFAKATGLHYKTVLAYNNGVNLPRLDSIDLMAGVIAQGLGKPKVEVVGQLTEALQ